MYESCFLSTARRVRAFYELGEACLDFRKACRLGVNVWGVSFDHWSAGLRLVETRRLHFDHRQACRKLIETLSVCFDPAKSMGSL